MGKTDGPGVGCPGLYTGSVVGSADGTLLTRAVEYESVCVDTGADDTRIENAKLMIAVGGVVGYATGSNVADTA